MSVSIPQQMRSLYYSAPGLFQVQEVDVPSYGDNDVLLKVSATGICGTDAHIHHGEFIAKFPLIPGHEVVGTIVQMGKNVTGFSLGDRCVADNTITCGTCFYCRRGKDLLCENFNSIGVTLHGGFADYVVFSASKLYKIFNLSDEEATLVEPAACAVHGLDKLNLKVGAEVLVIGGGPTGLLLLQLLRLNGATRVVLAGNKGYKMDAAKKFEFADEYVELDRANPDAGWSKLKEENPYGFDAVIEATGNEAVINNAINYVRRGGKLLVYGVYANQDRVHWSPEKIFHDEIEIIGSFAQTNCFPRAVAYLDSGKVKTKGLVTATFGIDEYQKALDAMAGRHCIKLAIKP